MYANRRGVAFMLAIIVTVLVASAVILGLEARGALPE